VAGAMAASTDQAPPTEPPAAEPSTEPSATTEQSTTTTATTTESTTTTTTEPSTTSTTTTTPAQTSEAKPASDGKRKERLCASLLKGEACRTEKEGKVCPFSHKVPKTHTRVYCCHLPTSYTVNELQKLFGNYGKITESKVLMDEQAGVSRGVAFVHFEKHEDALAAIAAVNGMKLPDHDLALEARFARLTLPGRSGTRGRFRGRGGFRDRDRGYGRGPRRGGGRDRYRPYSRRGDGYGDGYGTYDYYDEEYYEDDDYDDYPPPRARGRPRGDRPRRGGGGGGRGGGGYGYGGGPGYNY